MPRKEEPKKEDPKKEEEADFISKKVSYMCQAIHSKLADDGVKAFGNLTTDLERFTYIWKHPDTHVIMSLEPEYELKCIEKAQKHREKGNEYFQQQKYLTALGEYNVSVKFAPSHCTTDTEQCTANGNEIAEKASSLNQTGVSKIEKENCNNTSEQNGQNAAGEHNGEHALSTNGTENANISSKESPKNELALAYANRSAALFHLKRYKECLEDIELAFESNYPEAMHHKLYERQGACLRELGRKSDAIVSFQKAIDVVSLAGFTPKAEKTRIQVLTKLQDSCGKLEIKPKVDNDGRNEVHVPAITGETSLTHPHASSAVKVQYTNILGRHVVAARDVKVGDILMAENPYCAVMFPGKYAESHCSHCFSVLSIPVPCTQCSAVVFCSRQCRNSAWNTYHWAECSFGELLTPSSCAKIGRLALRLIMTVGIDSLLAYLKTNPTISQNPEKGGLNDEGLYSGDYNAIHNLVGNSKVRITQDLLDFTVTACFLMKILAESGYFKPIAHCETDIELIGGAMLSHLLIIQCNAKWIVELSYPERFDDPKPVFVGTGVYPTVALVNHSCDPNADLNFYGNAVVVRAIRNIYEGEEICISYGPTFYEVKQRTRSIQLKDAYHFTCRCEACRESWPVVQEMFDDVPKYKCEKCRCPLVVEDKSEKKIFTCAICKHKQDMEELVGKLQLSFDVYARAMNTAMNGRPDAALPNFIEHMLLLQTYIRHPWRDLASCQSAVKQCYRLAANVRQR